MSRKSSKRHRHNAQLVAQGKRFELGEALQLLQSMKKAKFNETVEVAMRLGVDPRKSDQMVRGVAKLPHGTGRSVRILVFAKGEKEQEAKSAGADFVGAESLVEKIQGGWLEFDKAIATPDMMPMVGRIAKILGPRGLMPNPKVGTVTVDVAKAVAEEKAGRVEFRVEKAGIVHVPIGKMDYTTGALSENFLELLEQVRKQKPVTSKGNYFQTITVKGTMSPGIPLDIGRLPVATTGPK